MSRIDPTNSELSEHRGEVLASSIAGAATGGTGSMLVGLESAARECEDVIVRGCLDQLARRMGRGEDFLDALAALEPRPPAHLRGMLKMAARSERMPELLALLLSARARQRRLGRSILIAIAYPLAILLICLALMAVVNILVAVPLRAALDSFAVTLPWSVRAMYWVQDQAFWLGAGVVLMLLLTLAILRLTLARRVWHTVLHSLPLAGAMWRWSATAELAGQLSLTANLECPVAESLELAAGGLFDQRIAAACHAAAGRVQSGESLARSLAQQPAIPPALVPAAAWGEANHSLGATMEQASREFEQAARDRADLLSAYVPAVLIVLTGAVVLVAAVTLLAPVMTLIQGLL